MSRKRQGETRKIREQRLMENTKEKVDARQEESDLIDERVRANIRQHGP